MFQAWGEPCCCTALTCDLTFCSTLQNDKNVMPSEPSATSEAFVNDLVQRDEVGDPVAGDIDSQDQNVFIPAMSSGDRALATLVKSYCENIGLLYYNTRSIVCKVNELIAICLLQNLDIVCVVETWLDSDVQNTEISIPNYELVCLDRDRHGGGVAIYLASYLPFSVISSGSHSLEFLSISVESPFGQFVVSVLHRPPSFPISFFENLHLVLEDLYVTACSNLIFGDFNVDVSVSSYLCNCLCNVTYQYGLSIIPTGHTRITTSSATTIDLMLATAPESVMSCETVPPLGTSDHNAILSVVSLRIHSAAPQVSRRVWKYNYADFDHAQELLSQIDHDSVVVKGDVDASWSNWEQMFLRVMEVCIPTTTLSRRKNLPWLFFN